MSRWEMPAPHSRIAMSSASVLCDASKGESTRTCRRAGSEEGKGRKRTEEDPFPHEAPPLLALRHIKPLLQHQLELVRPLARTRVAASAGNRQPCKLLLPEFWRRLSGCRGSWHGGSRRVVNAAFQSVVKVVGDEVARFEEEVDVGGVLALQVLPGDHPSGVLRRKKS